MFNGLFYKQNDGVAMGSPLGPALPNSYLSYHEKNWLNNCPQGFKSVFYRRYVYDIFILFKSNDHLTTVTGKNFCFTELSTKIH